MIVDSSALVAILRQDPDARMFAAALEEQPSRVSAATLVETSLVVGPDRLDNLEHLVQAAGMDIVAFDREQWLESARGHARFGRGSGSKARLNLGDCFSYALAKVTGEPLLFKGDDFVHTDVTPAVPGPSS